MCSFLDEDKEVIKLAKQLIEKWTRILMNNVIDYRRLLEENEVVSKFIFKTLVFSLTISRD